MAFVLEVAQVGVGPSEGRAEHQTNDVCLMIVVNELQNSWVRQLLKRLRLPGKNSIASYPFIKCVMTLFLSEGDEVARRFLVEQQSSKPLPEGLRWPNLECCSLLRPD